MAQGFLIRTPTDFERTIGGVGDFIKALLVTPAPEIEPAFRRALDGIFEDLDCIDSSDHGLLASYLEGIKNPLDDLHDLGFMLFAIVIQVRKKIPGKPLGPTDEREILWKRAYYLVIPLDGFFRVGEDTKGNVHRFSPDCDTAVAGLARAAQDQTRITLWFSANGVRQLLEHNVPWCQGCCLDQVLRG